MKKNILLLSLLSTAACTPTYEDLSQWMTQTHKEAKSKIIPFEAPTVLPPKPYIPINHTGLNAFDSHRLNNMQSGTNAPNLNRSKETLEAFSLENLRYVGSLNNGRKISGFIEVDNHVYTVYPGNHLGQNYGKIQSITPDKIVLLELIEDSYGNWIYRNAELPLSNNTKNDGNGANTSTSAPIKSVTSPSNNATPAQIQN